MGFQSRIENSSTHSRRLPDATQVGHIGPKHTPWDHQTYPGYIQNLIPSLVRSKPTTRTAYLGMNMSDDIYSAKISMFEYSSLERHEKVSSHRDVDVANKTPKNQIARQWSMPVYVSAHPRSRMTNIASHNKRYLFETKSMHRFVDNMNLMIFLVIISLVAF
jgi:hypothetical protein